MTTNNNTETKTPTKMSYNPLNNTLQTLEIKDKTIENYFNQIKTNFYSAVKAHYLIARDLFDAKSNLQNEDYQRLIEQCGFSGSTQKKYLSIGSDVRLMRLFIVGKLPMKWTNQYLLTTLTDTQFKKVESKIDADTTANQIKKIADLPKKQVEKFENMLLTFLSIEIDKSKVNVAKFKTILENVKNDLSKYPEIEFVDKADDVEVKISSYFQKQIEKKNKDVKKKSTKRKSNEISKIAA
jgi:hypothetical protein